MTIAQTLGNIRKVESGSTKSLREFEKAVRSVKRVMVKASQVEGRKVFKRNARRYARGQYANRRGALVRVGDDLHGLVEDDLALRERVRGRARHEEKRDRQ